MTFDMSPDAEKLLDVLIEEVRKQISPNEDPAIFNEAARCLMQLGYAKFYDDGDGNLTFEPTREGLDMGMLQ